MALILKGLGAACSIIGLFFIKDHLNVSIGLASFAIVFYSFGEALES